jgi:polysaccharide biosynthesis protein PslH
MGDRARQRQQPHRREGPLKADISILAVTSEVPWPLDSGGHLRTFHLLRALASRMNVRLVVPSARQLLNGRHTALAEARVTARVVPVTERNLAGESARMLSAAVRGEPYVLFSRHRRRQVKQALADEIQRQRPDVLYLDHLDSLVYVRRGEVIPYVLDMHNVYSRLASRAAAETPGFLRRRYLSGQAALLEQVERRAVRLAHTVLAVSEEEADYFRTLGARRVVVVPNGVDCDAFGAGVPRTNPRGAPRILYVGSLAWPPNAAAAKFLATDVLAEVRRELPDARVILIGKNPPPEITALASADGHVSVAANVPDVQPYYLDADVLAVPLDAGGGTRLKILEAFAAGVPVVSTAIGCEGIGAVHGTHLLVAERHEMAATIVRLLRDPACARALAERARALARERFDWSIVGALARAAVTEAAE